MDGMETFTDKLSGLAFCVKKGTPSARHMAEHGIFEHQLIKWSEQFLPKDGVFLDIGAHAGTYALCLASKCAYVHAFECESSTVAGLKEGVKLNGCGNVFVHAVALGAFTGTALLHKNSPDGGSSTLYREISEKLAEDPPSESVTVRTLDSFELPRVDFVKIDVEGSELSVLVGGIETLKRTRYPPILFEAWPDAWYRARKEALLAFLKGLGYTVCEVAGTANMFLAADHPARR